MKVLVHGNQVNYSLEGPAGGPVIMASHALATSLSLWEPQIDALGRQFRILRYDTLGHGATDAPKGPYSLAQLAEQALGLLAALGIERVHFLGLSMGGMIGQMMALQNPGALSSLMLGGSTSRIPPEAQPLWQERIRIAESEGMEPLVEPTIGRWFTAGFRSGHPQVVDRVRGMIRGTPPQGYAGCCHAISALNLTDQLGAIHLPTLVLVGDQDPSMPIAVSRTIHERIGGSELVILPSASHLSCVEQADTFNSAVLSFLGRVS